MAILFDLNAEVGFTDAEKTISRYILSHADEMATLSIGELASKTNTSNASIVRLCRKLGTSGYREFRLAFLRETERRPANEPQVDVSYPFHDRSSPAAVSKNMADVHRFAVNASYQAVNAVDLQKAANMIRTSQRVFFYGKGESDLVARIFARRLMRIGYLPVFADDYDEKLAITSMATPNDVAIFISYSGSGLFMFQHDRALLAEKRVPTLIISANSSLQGFTHGVFFPKAEVPEDNAATFYSTSASLYVTDAIYGVLFAMDYKRVRSRKNVLDSFLRGFIAEEPR